ncbi:hypothetical protein XA68_11870 [Ophiocordyceps unilateralis]|uniref:HCNGP-like protein n=1 Tax=Ophiocordyceps unilateralis TaxID=268505 RepID=A0A2A9PFJ4_OPHUN|nr:hypothetical protein XA68_11870 [Ophiocordyceps unilateralis]
MAGLVGYNSSDEESDEAKQEPPPIIGPIPQSALPLGPSLPPPEASASASDVGASPSPNPATKRALIHHLTLPAVPDLDIPPSPPGSPPTRASKSFQQFLELKKKKGTHFNAKLEQSISLRNPSVMDKLMDFVELDGSKQYETTLSADLWNPTAFPETAFFDELRKSRERMAKEREADRASGNRSSIDFVSSTVVNHLDPQPPGGLAKGEKSRSRWK